ncbi:hypothetical protein VVR84_09415 [Kocuria carniphila]|uniref:Uncharacterized protein n=1 Tax=Kocuria carniphila TaxID=262208 RepID=A0ABV3V409_9MICC|nr:hypothetical protein [Brevibacterium aurantiacum]
MDGHVVGTVAGEAVDLVDDAVGDLMGLDVLDHPHQLGPIGLAGGLAGIDEFLGDDRVQVAGLAQIRFALRGDREALVAASLGGLFLGGHAQVRHRKGGGLADAVQSGRGGWLCDGHGSCSLPRWSGPAQAAATAGAVRLVKGNTTRQAPKGASRVSHEGQTGLRTTTKPESSAVGFLLL